ncbi:MAG: HNH endonuclease [Planctomycetes bacterium]|nr:HNH endonuclease [Planctomycetota bacterium]
MDKALRDQIQERADNRCEYCRIPQVADPFYTFPVDHIIARQHRGTTTLDNLALSCYRCNMHKGPNIASLDPDTSEMVPLFHPRRDTWSEHFEWNEGILVGRTPIGRATVELLAINHPDHVLLREALIDEGVFPLDD